MKQHIELYIGDRLVELSENVVVLFTYQTDDTQNPTIIKNNFSKTIQLDGTPANKRIFGSFWDINKVVGEGGVGASFNPNKRVDFTLYNNGEIVESGYVKLNRVRINEGKTTFDITLFGGMGDFIYNLTNKDEQTKLQLSDLELPFDNQFPIMLHRTFVKEGWDNLKDGIDNNDIHSFVNFAPCYNGIPDNITADKVLIDKRSLPFHIPDITEDEKTYTSNGNFYISNLGKEYDEWQIRDIKAVNQRPVVKFKYLLDAMFNPLNNGGYDTELDEDFFNEDNPYYNNIYLTRPLVSEMKDEDTGNDVYLYEDGDRFYFNGLDEDDEFKVNIPFTFKAQLENNSKYGLFLGTNLKDENGNEYLKCNKAFYVIAVLYDSNDIQIGATPLYKFTSDIDGALNFSFRNEYHTPVVLRKGCKFTKDGNSNIYNLSWKEKNYENVIDLNLTGSYQNGMYIKLVTGMETIGGNENNLFYYKDNRADIYDDTNIDKIRYKVKKYSESFDTKLLINILRTLITKKNLLDDEYTPADYLLSYIKMFNLHLIKDAKKKLIKIVTDENYHKREFVDLSDLIDRNNDVEIIPLTFENKWLKMANEYSSDSVLSKKYKDIYGGDFGSQLIDTNYNFDSSTLEIFNNLTFKGGIMNKRIDRYNMKKEIYNPYTGAEGFATGFMFNGFTPILTDISGNTKEGSFIQMQSGTPIYKDKPYWDITSKVSFEDKDKKGIDGKNVLLFFDGITEFNDLGYNLTDNILEFETLNENKICWIYTNDDESDYATRLDYLPNFSRYITNGDWVEYSLDFGTPREIYTDLNINLESDIYHRYWDEYVGDKYNENTRTLTAFVWLKERVLGDWLRRIYYFDGSYWYLNKIIDYNQTGYNTTKCEFIKTTRI